MGEIWDDEGRSIANPALRRVTEDEMTEIAFVDAEDTARPHGIWIPLEATWKTFTMRVEEPGTIRVENLGEGQVGVEWMQDA